MIARLVAPRATDIQQIFEHSYFLEYSKSCLMILFPNIFFTFSLKNLCQNGSIGIAFIRFRIVITKNKLKFPQSDSIYLIEYLKKV